MPPLTSVAGHSRYVLEAEMAGPVIERSKRWWGRREPDVVAVEVVAPGAIADVLGCSFGESAVRARLAANATPLLEWAPVACVSACAHQPRTTAELAVLTGLSQSSVCKAVARAIAAGALRREGRFLKREREWRPVARRLVAVELKLTDWWKALKQAESYARWADASWVVMGGTITEELYGRCEAGGLGLGRLSRESFDVLLRPRTHKIEAFNTARLLASEQALAAYARALPTPASTRGRDAALPGFAY